MKCKMKDVYDVYLLSANNAQKVLDELGFGHKDVARTYNDDGRYGRILSDRIEYGFTNMHGAIQFGDYVLPHSPFDWFDKEILSANQFHGYYEIVDKTDD